MEFSNRLHFDFEDLNINQANKEQSSRKRGSAAAADTTPSHPPPQLFSFNRRHSISSLDIAFFVRARSDAGLEKVAHFSPFTFPNLPLAELQAEIICAADLNWRLEANFSGCFRLYDTVVVGGHAASPQLLQYENALKILALLPPKIVIGCHMSPLR